MVMEILFGFTYLAGLRPMYHSFEDFADLLYTETGVRINQPSLYAMTAVWPVTELVMAVMELLNVEVERKNDDR